jgi:hypothetical protein
MSSTSLVERVRIGTKNRFPGENHTNASQDVFYGAKTRCRTRCEAKDLVTLKRGVDGLRTPRQLEILETLDVEKDLFCTVVVLPSRLDDSLTHGHITSHLHSSKEGGCQVLNEGTLYLL